MANSNLIHRHIAVAVHGGNHRIDLAGQRHCLIVATATNRVLQRHVLGNADKTKLIDRDSKRGLSIKLTSHCAANYQVTF